MVRFSYAIELPKFNNRPQLRVTFRLEKQKIIRICSIEFLRAKSLHLGNMVGLVVRSHQPHVDAGAKADRRWAE